MCPVNVYEYRDSRQFLVDAFRGIKEKEPALTLRSFSRTAGISHTLLVMLMQGKRPLRVKHAPSLAKALSLTSQERLYFQALVQFNSAEDAEERNLCTLWLSDLHPQRNFRCKEVDEFWVISHWIHMAIYAMTDLAEFKKNPITAEAVGARVRFPVDVLTIQAAIARMLSLGLLARDETGGIKSVYREITTPDDVANMGARRYHTQAMELARTALDKDEPRVREFQSLSISIDRGRLPAAKEKIRKFRSQFVQEFWADGGSDVYQLNLQFFQLTESPASVDSTEAVDEGVDAEGFSKHEVERENHA